MKHTTLTLKENNRQPAMYHTCIVCKEKFELSKTEVNMIESGEIGPLDVNICDDCADRASELYSYEYEQFSDADCGL